ncbi:unnamed protein product [Gongylonema pulchrum]|uniref:Uncharacterized protein n=1 Tax=Gongylonema pulchrum TaxID=637853 RepID=A0A183D5N3_9BILA|nr:unnamed protein product [Gongylonema pulchrum]
MYPEVDQVITLPLATAGRQGLVVAKPSSGSCLESRLRDDLTLRHTLIYNLNESMSAVNELVSHGWIRINSSSQPPIIMVSEARACGGKVSEGEFMRAFASDWGVAMSPIWSFFCSLSITFYCPGLFTTLCGLLPSFLLATFPDI